MINLYSSHSGDISFPIFHTTLPLQYIQAWSCAQIWIFASPIGHFWYNHLPGGRNVNVNVLSCIHSVVWQETKTESKRKSSRANRSQVTKTARLLFYITVYLFSSANPIQPYRLKSLFAVVAVVVVLCCTIIKEINCQQGNSAGGHSPLQPANRKKSSKFTIF